MNFLKLQNDKLLIYPDNIEKDTVIEELFILRKKYEDLCRLNCEEKTIFQAAKLEREEIKSLKDTMPWSPRPSDLEVGQFVLSPYLEQLLNTILSGKRDCSDTSSKCTRLKQSFGQDMIYAVSNGKINTPKSILFPQSIKALTNNTELKSITNKLGHGVCYSILQELATENAYRISNQQESEFILLDGATLSITSIDLKRHSQVCTTVLFFNFFVTVMDFLYLEHSLSRII